MKVLALLALIIAASLLSFPSHSISHQPSDSITVTLGSPEIVMDYSLDTCRRANGLDLPDIQARAVRSPINESIILISGNAPANYTMTGPDFDHLERDCTAVLHAGDSPLAYTFDNQEWILSVYREKKTIHALVHNEYHDPQAEGCKVGDTSPANPCWYNGITYAVSIDAGQTFTQPPAPHHVVAALPIPWQAPSTGNQRGNSLNPHGYFTPTNIVSKDGYYYSMFFAIPLPDEPAARGTCLMRTDNLSDPQSWRAWDGNDFTITMPSPYDTQGNPAPTGKPHCSFVSPETISDLNGSLTFNSYLGKYILVGSGVSSVNRALTCGTYFALSDNLINWSKPQLMMAGKLPYPPCSTDGNPNGSIIYPSLIDHKDTSINFVNTGQTFYLYYVLWNDGLDRDLIRISVKLGKD